MNIKLGPEMRAVYPFVLNFKLSGEVELNGAAHPSELKPSGAVMFESGEINLVATQVRGGALCELSLGGRYTASRL